jgi:pseudouridine synthase
MEIRINKFLADHGIASRRAIDALIAEKRIAINGVPLEKPGAKVRSSDIITLDGKRIIVETKRYVTILLNKPTDCITTARDTHGRKTVLDYIKVRSRVFPIGRLDKNTTGVLLLTNDGDLSNMLMHPRYSIEKIYRAYLDKPLDSRHKNEFESGLVLDGKKTAPCTVRSIHGNRRDVFVTLHEGKNRQIHRMFAVLGYRVQKLERTRYAGLSAEGLQPGEWRYLEKKEVDQLRS